MNPILNSKVLGKGRPICILHGFLGMSDNWKTLGAAYANKGFNVHLIDQRNHGKSFHSEDFNYDFLANDLKIYLDALNITKTSIIGHSMGGKTAMQFACNFPEMTEKLLVADIAPKFYPPHHHEIIDALRSVNLAIISSRTEADVVLKKQLSNIGIRQFLLKNLYWTKEKNLAFRFNLPVLSKKMEEVGENIRSTDNFTGPTLFLRGSKSEYVTENDIDDIQKHFSNGTLDTVSNAGHWLHAENPKEFLEKSLAFLS
ncbi:alpha/beta fold hydrolase [Maribacter antarcticus]|uniref:alpha/beta fold hydrolase n=1 Tax=Maribacter antarcticus TaxID=505250 RepID=UPI000478C790|nr:alpha/beta fold hydrolase [Maribacter antarcticus]